MLSSDPRANGSTSIVCDARTVCEIERNGASAGNVDVIPVLFVVPASPQEQS